MHFIKTNVAKEEDWEQLIENTLDKFGRMDILVNNAGTSYRNKVSLSFFSHQFHLSIFWKGAEYRTIKLTALGHS